ncbi:MAG: alpha/beta hydrolase [Proteobacteria bacterium]|nr:alpha/beta hydrolase [Pseudomonadota bacterium]
MRRDHRVSTPRGDFHLIDWGGQGPLAVICHATGFCAGAYNPLAERLSSDLHPVGLDDRGHGLSTAPADPRRLGDWYVFADDLGEVLASLGEPAVVIGHSRGGTVGLLAAARRPDLVRALVLMDPTILPFHWMWWWWIFKKLGLSRRVPIAARAAKRRAVWPDQETLLAAYRGKKNFEAWQGGWLEAYVRECTRPDGDGRIRLGCDPAWESRAFAVCAHDVWRYVPRLAHPTLVLYGDRSDTFLPPAARRFRAKAPGARLIALEGTSHFVPMERPEECRELIVDFLREAGIIS